MSRAQANSSIGVSLPRVDGVDKVTGRALYVDDLEFPGAWHGATLRSRVAHGVLKKLTLATDFDWQDIVVVTAEDFGKTFPGKNVIHLIEDDQPALVPIGGRIKHQDEPLALVAAPTKARARAALAHIIVEVDELPAALDLDTARRAEVVLYGKDNVFKSFAIDKGGDVEKALAASDLVIEGTYRTGAQEQMYIEPQGAVAFWDERGCHIVGSLQCPYYVHKALKVLLDLPDEQVIVAQAVTGGGFGGKEEYPSIVAAHAALLARKAKRTVKLIYDRAEDIGATTKRHPCVVRHRLGLRKDGKILAADVDVTFDGGAYITLTPVVLSRGVLHAAGPYDIPNVRIRGRALATNHPPHGAFRGFGAPQTTFAYERQVDKAARALGMDPFAMRRLNMLRLGSETATGQKLNYSVGSEQVLDRVSAAVKGAAAQKLPARVAAGHERLGRGLAFYFHGSGFTGSGEERLKGRVTVALTKDGLFEVRSGSTDIGQGMLTIFTQIAAAALEIRPEVVRVLQARTDLVPDSGPTVASRTCMVVGAVVEQASLGLRERLRRWAKDNGRDTPTADIESLGRAYAAEKGELAETAVYTSPPNVRWDDATYTGDAYPVYGWAACWVELRVDLETYEVTLDRCVHAVDVGKAIHPVIVSGQIEGGTLQALGWALWESVQYDKGRVKNRRMTDSIIPTAIEAPELETLVVENPYPHGPFGAKGVGEIPMDGPAAAVANALEDALGVPCDELPLLPEVLLRLDGARSAA